MKYLVILSLLCAGFISGCTSLEKKRQLAQAHLELGIGHYKATRYPEALREILKAQKLDPSSPTILNALGLAYHSRGRSDLGAKSILEALSINPSYTEARNNLVQVYIETKNYSEAQKQLDIVKKDLTYGALDRVFFNQGLIHFDQQKYQQALEPFSKAIEYSRDNCSAHHFYGRSLFETKRYAEAAVALDRAIAFCQKSGNDEPHYYSALAHYRSGDKRKAIVRFGEIIQLYPNGQYAERSKSLLEMVRKEL